MSHPWGEVGRHAPDPKPSRMHAEAADRLDDMENPFSIGEHVEHRRELADILRHGSVENQVTCHPEQLGEHDPNHLRAGRHGDAGKLLDRHDIGKVVHHPAEVVDAIGVGDVGVPCLALAHLFGGTMMKPDLRDRVDDLLALELEDDAEHAMHARMVGAEVEEHEIGGLAVPLHAPFLGAEAQRLLLGDLALLSEDVRLHLGRPCDVVLAKRVACPGRRRQDAA